MLIKGAPRKRLRNVTERYDNTLQNVSATELWPEIRITLSSRSQAITLYVTLEPRVWSMIDQHKAYTNS